MGSSPFPLQMSLPPQVLQGDSANMVIKPFLAALSSLGKGAPSQPMAQPACPRHPGSVARGAKSWHCCRLGVDQHDGATPKMGHPWGSGTEQVGGTRIEAAWHPAVGRRIGAEGLALAVG